MASGSAGGMRGMQARRNAAKAPRVLVAYSTHVAPGYASIVMPLVIESESNQRGHWSVTHRRKLVQQRAVRACFAMARPWLRETTAPHGWRVQLTRLAPRVLDSGNLEASFKHVQDEVARILGVDDGDRARVSWGYGQRAGMPAGAYGLVVEITVQGAQ